MPPKAEGEQISRRAQSGFIIPGFLRELGAIMHWGAPAVKEKIFVREKSNPAAMEDKIRRGTEALTVFETHLKTLEEPDASDRYRAIFGDEQNPACVQHGGPFWGVSFVGKGWNSFAVKFETATGSWVIKVGFLYSPNPLFFISPSDPQHSREIRQNIEHIEKAAEQKGVEDFVPHPQEIVYLPLSQYDGKAVTIQVMPFVEQLSKEQLRESLRDDATAQHLLEEMEAIDRVRRVLQSEHDSEFDMNGGGNLAVVWKYDSHGQRYPGFQLIDVGLRIYGLNTPITDNFFDFTGLLQGFFLRHKIRRTKFTGIVADFRRELEITRQGRIVRSDIRREIRTKQLNEAFGFWGPRTRRNGNDTDQAA